MVRAWRDGNIMRGDAIIRTRYVVVPTLNASCKQPKTWRFCVVTVPSYKLSRKASTSSVEEGAGCGCGCG